MASEFSGRIVAMSGERLFCISCCVGYFGGCEVVEEEQRSS
jgi:hypothetical protein